MVQNFYLEGKLQERIAKTNLLNYESAELKNMETKIGDIYEDTSKTHPWVTSQPQPCSDPA